MLTSELALSAMSDLFEQCNWRWRSAFDVGEYGVGRLASPAMKAEGHSFADPVRANPCTSNRHAATAGAVVRARGIRDGSALR